MQEDINIIHDNWLVITHPKHMVVNQPTIQKSWKIKMSINHHVVVTNIKFQLGAQLGRLLVCFSVPWRWHLVLFVAPRFCVSCISRCPNQWLKRKDMFGCCRQSNLAASWKLGRLEISFASALNSHEKLRSQTHKTEAKIESTADASLLNQQRVKLQAWLMHMLNERLYNQKRTAPCWCG